MATNTPNGTQTLKHRATPFTSFPAQRRVIGSRTSFVSVKYFHYDKQNFGVATNVGSPFADSTVYQTTTGVIEEEITSMKISKSIGNSGSFELHLKPTQNWKTVLSPGDWVAIYIFDKYRQKNPNGDTDTTNLLMLGNIDRVSRSLQKNTDNDKVVLQYIVSGRSSMKALEETDIWFDPYVNQDQTLDVLLRTAGLEIQGNPAKLVQNTLDIFMGPGAQLSAQRTQALGQWRIPAQVANLFGVKSGYALGASKPSYYDILDTSIPSTLPGFKTRGMLSPDSSGSVWEMMRRFSNELVNEIFVEDVRADDGSVMPTLVLRPRPLQTPFFTATESGNSQFGSEDAAVRPYLKKAYQSLQDLGKTSFIEISPAEILFEDLGKDDHSRMNMFWLRTQQSYEYAYSRVATVKSTQIANPFFQRDSIGRYGLKRFDQLLDFCWVEGADGNAEKAPDPDASLFKAFMAQVYDMNYANHLYDVGSITCSGVLEAELGKALVVLADPAIAGSRKKLFYIEGYEHDWTFPSSWRTTFTLTHGQFSQADNKDPNIFVDCIGPGDFGAADATINTAYLNKTRTEKK